MRTCIGVLVGLVLVGCSPSPSVEEAPPRDQETSGAPSPVPDPDLDISGPAEPAAKREFARALRATLGAGTGSFEHRLAAGPGGSVHDKGRYALEATLSALTRVIEVGEDRIIFQMITAQDRVYMRRDDQQETWGCWAEFGASQMAEAAGLDAMAAGGVPAPLVALSWGQGHHRAGGGIVGSTDLSVALAMLGGKAAAAYAVPPDNHDVAPVRWHLRDGYVVSVSLDLVSVDAAARRAGFEPAGAFAELFESGASTAVTASARLDPGPVEPIRPPDAAEVIKVAKNPDFESEMAACSAR